MIEMIEIVYFILLCFVVVCFTAIFRACLRE